MQAVAKCLARFAPFCGVIANQDLFQQCGRVEVAGLDVFEIAVGGYF